MEDCVGRILHIGGILYLVEYYIGGRLCWWNTILVKDCVGGILYWWTNCPG